MSITTLPRFDSELLTREQAAVYLGITASTLAVWKSKGRYDLPCVKIGRLAKYRKVDLDHFIARNTIGSQAA
jgi:excisionase family DNA binding protein